jgi:hypothetical protein
VLEMAEIIVLSSDDESGVDDSVSLSDQEERLEEFLGCLTDEVDEEAKGLLRLRFRQSHPLYLKSKAFEEELSRCTRILNSDNVHVLVADVLDLLEKNSRVVQVKEQWKQRRYDTPERDPSQAHNDLPTLKRPKIEEDVTPETEVTVSVGLNGAQSSAGQPELENTGTKGSETKLQERLEAMRQHKMKKLDRKLEILSKHIKRCAEMEMDMEDLDNEHSTYLAEDKLKRKYIQVQEKLCKLRDEMLDTRERSFRYTGSDYDEINKSITRWVRKNKDFPDVDDIKGVVKKTNKKHNLGMSKEKVGEESKSVMMDLGKKLQEFRHQQFVRDFGSHLTDSFDVFADPAHKDEDLKGKLDSQDAFYEDQMEKLVDDFVQRQEKGGEEFEQHTPVNSPLTPEESQEDSVEATGNTTDRQRTEESEDSY